MTRLPTESRAVRGVDGEPYELNMYCAKPGCDQPSADPHHLWRRSELIGPYWWVYLEDDEVTVGNVVGLCQLHHHAITVNSAWINWNGDRFVWTDLVSPSSPLSFQPPVRPGSDEEPLQTDQEKNGDDLVKAFTIDEAGVDLGVLRTIADGSCPTCLRPLPHPKAEKEPKRERRTWSVTVPKDEREDGAQTIDTLVEESRKELAKAGMPYGDADTAKFFVLTHALSLFVTHADEVLTDA